MPSKYFLLYLIATILLYIELRYVHY